MIPEYFVQTEFNDGKREGKAIKLLLTFSYLVKVFSLGFVVLSAVFSVWWYLFGFGALYAIGIVMRQAVLQRTEAYEYFLVKNVLKISMRNNFHTQKTLCEIPLEHIKSIETLKAVEVDTKDKEGIFAYPERKSIIKIRFIENTETKNLYFAPSRYLLALIQSRRKLI